MIVTEKKLVEMIGYTSSQIRGRRLLHWEDGIHYFTEPGGATVYDKARIEEWMVSARTEVNAESGGTKMGAGNRLRSISRTQKLV